MPKGTNEKQQRPKSSTTHYVSFNPDEWAALELLGFRERWAYMQLKWLANFKTGVVGNFGKQKITYVSLAKLVTAPGVQGRGLGSIDDTQAADFLRRMQEVGLVSAITTRGNGGLCFELPLSPISRKPSGVLDGVDQKQLGAANSPDHAAAQPAIFPDDDVPPFDDLPVTAQPVSHPLSVVTLKESNTSNDGAPSACAEDAPSRRAPGAAAVREIAIADTTPSQAPALAARRLSARQIRDNLAADWDWEQVDSLQSESLYAQWAFEGVTEDQLFQAKLAVVADGADADCRHRPTELAPHLTRGGAVGHHRLAG